MKHIIKKHGYGMIAAAIATDSYRRTVMNDDTNKKLDLIQKEMKLFEEQTKLAKDDAELKLLNEVHEKARDLAVRSRHMDAVEEHKAALEALSADPNSVYNKAELERTRAKLVKAYEECTELTQSNFFDYIESFYNIYVEFIDSLNGDKIICVVNIIMGSMTLTSFITILSTLLSDNLINQITFLERYPKILAILKLRSGIKKGFIIVNLSVHFAIILWALSLNIYMLFL